MKFEISNLNDYQEIIKIIKDRLIKTNILVLYLIGDLGAGKTTFTQILSKEIGLKNQITSPTFTIINEYKNENLNLYHLDLYRLNNKIELDELNLSQYKYPRTGYNLIIIEWPDLFATELDELFYDIPKITIRFSDNLNNRSSRLIEVLV